MPVNFGDLTMMTLVADSSTPQSLLGLAGIRIMLRDDDVAGLPAGIDTISASGVTVPGYWRPAGTRLIEWVITPLPDPNIAMLNALPGPGGWVDLAARGVWANVGLELLKRGLPGEDLRAGFPLLFNAAKAEVLAEL